MQVMLVSNGYNTYLASDWFPPAAAPQEGAAAAVGPPQPGAHDGQPAGPQDQALPPGLETPRHADSQSELGSDAASSASLGLADSARGLSQSCTTSTDDQSEIVEAAARVAGNTRRLTQTAPTRRRYRGKKSIYTHNKKKTAEEMLAIQRAQAQTPPTPLTPEVIAKARKLPKVDIFCDSSGRPTIIDEQGKKVGLRRHSSGGAVSPKAAKDQTFGLQYVYDAADEPNPEFKPIWVWQAYNQTVMGQTGARIAAIKMSNKQKKKRGQAAKASQQEEDAKKRKMDELMKQVQEEEAQAQAAAAEAARASEAAAAKKRQAAAPVEDEPPKKVMADAQANLEMPEELDEEGKEEEMPLEEEPDGAAEGADCVQLLPSIDDPNVNWDEHTPPGWNPFAKNASRLLKEWRALQKENQEKQKAAKQLGTTTGSGAAATSPAGGDGGKPASATPSRGRPQPVVP